MTDDRAQGRLAQALRQTLDGFPQQARDQVAAMAESLGPALAQVAGNEHRDPDLSEALALAHRLAGSASSLGFPTLGRRAAALEVLLETMQTTEGGATVHALRQAALLLGCLQDGVASLSPDSSTLLSQRARGDGAGAMETRRFGTGDTIPGLLLIGVFEDDPGWAPLIARMGDYGWETRTAARQTDMDADDPAVEMADPVVPDLVVIDLDTVPDGLALARSLCGSEGRWPGRPWYLAQSDPGAAWRGRAAAAGCAGVMAKPLAAESLLDHLAAVRAASTEEGSRVLLHDADPATAEVMRFLLDAAGLQVERHASPAAIAHALAEGAADAVVLCEREPADGARPCIDLAMAIRQDPAFDIPGLVLVVPEGLVAPEPDPVALELARGGDVVVTRPVDPDLFPVLVTGQAVRALGRRRRARCEGDGPVLLAETLASEADRLLGRARSLDLPLAVAWIGRSRESEAANAAVLDAVLVRRLRQALGARDLIGRGANAGLVVVMPSLTEAEARSRLDPVVASLPRLLPGTQAALGVVAPMDGEAIGGLLARACQAAGPEGHSQAAPRTPLESP
jgi:CheY-like chemotaxis protein